MSTTHTNQGPREEDDRPDPVLDSLLSEMLGNVPPPRIAPRHGELASIAREEARQSGLFTPEELDAAARIAWEETQLTSITPPPVMPKLPSGPRATVPVRKRTNSESAPWLLVAVAASLVGLFLILALSRTAPNQPQLVLDTRTMPKVGAGFDRESPFPDESAKTLEEPVQASSPKIAAEGVAPSVPTPPAPSSTEDPSDRAWIARGADAISAPAGEAEISAGPSTALNERTRIASADLNLGSTEDISTVAVIDEQFRNLWERLEITPRPATDLNVLEDRLAQLLIGRMPTSAERAWVRSAGGGISESVPLLAKRWIESEEFDRHWATVLMDYYLGGAASDGNEEDKGRFQQWLQNSIQNNVALGAMDRAILTADPSQKEPQSYWLTQWSRSNSGSLRSLVSTHALPTGVPESQLAALETVSMQTLRLAGRFEVACAQCHQVESAQALAALGWKGAGSGAEVHQPGPLLGVAAAIAPLLGGPQSELFFADANDKLSKILPYVPDGQKLTWGGERRQALGDWIETSKQARAPLADYVWFRMLGQPLVPRVGLSNEEGARDRRDLLDFLASSLSNQSSGLRQLVYWIAVSDPSAMEASQLDAARFLSLDEAALIQQQRKKHLFARYSGNPQERLPQNGMANLVRWFEPSSEELTEKALLAQPVGRGPIEALSSKQLRLEKNPSLWTPERTAVELSDAVPYTKVRDWADAMASHPMAWDAVVDHAFLVCLSRYPNLDERSNANKLLDWSSGDRRLAASRLINALLGQL